MSGGRWAAISLLVGAIFATAVVLVVVVRLNDDNDGPAAATTTNVTLVDAAPGMMIGNVDTNPDHWQRLDTYPSDTEYEAHAFDGDTVVVIPEFPVNMNDCDSGQTRISWRALNGTKVTPGITGFLDPGMRPEEFGKFGAPAESGTMVMGNCEQPMWKLDGRNFRVAVEAGFYGPDVGG